jgi:hypothetical protein
MGSIRCEIEVSASLAEVRATWEHFIKWILNGGRRLVCDEFACVSAVQSGNVTFAPDGEGTKVAFRLEAPDGESAPSCDDLQRHMIHDLLVFKDYIERGGMAAGKPTTVEDITLEHDAGQKGDKPRHHELSSESDSTFWRSHFPS